MADPTDIHAIERPDPALLRYYLLTSLLAGPFFPVAMAVLIVRFRTMRYRFDDEGISMRWGALFRREIHLTYARVQDIHLASNVVERWLGLARIEIQTASGSAKAEMTLEGIPEFEAVRDFLYARMRGMRDSRPQGATGSAGPEARGPLGPPGRPRTPAGDDDLAAVLREVADELRALRAELARPGAGAPSERPSARPEGTAR